MCICNIIVRIYIYTYICTHIIPGFLNYVLIFIFNYTIVLKIQILFTDEFMIKQLVTFDTNLEEA